MDKLFKRLKKSQLPDFLNKEIGTDVKIGDKVISCMTGKVYIVTNVRQIERFTLEQVMQYDMIEDCKRTFWHKPRKRTIYSYIKTYRRL